MKLRTMAVFVTLICVIGVPLRGAAQTPSPQAPEKEKSLRALMELIGVSKLTEQILDQMIASFKQADTSVPEKFWTDFRSRFKGDEMAELILPIYDKHFTKEEVDGLIAFYKSPLGQKVLAALPQITQESMAAGEKWGRAKAEEVMRELQQKRNAQSKPTATEKSKAVKSGKTAKTKKKGT